MGELKSQEELEASLGLAGKKLYSLAGIASMHKNRRNLELTYCQIYNELVKAGHRKRLKRKRYRGE